MILKLQIIYQVIISVKKVMIHWFVTEMREENRGKFDPVHEKTTKHTALLPLMRQIIISYHLKISQNNNQIISFWLMLWDISLHTSLTN